MTSALFRRARRAAPWLATACLALSGCVAPTSDDEALFRMFWVQPDDLLARARVPAGLGVAERPTLVLTLVESADRPARVASFRLQPASTAAPSDTTSGTTTGTSPAYTLARGDHGRFRGFQERVVASIGPNARVSVRLDIAYCADLSQSPGMGPPVAEVVDLSNGTVMMIRPAPTTARSLQPVLPPC